MNNYPEGDSFNMDITLYESDSSEVTPSTLRYRIDCLTSKKTVRDWTDVTPSSSPSIPITPDDNAIINDRDRYEVRELVLESNYGTSSAKIFRRRWQVENLQGLS